MPAKLYVYNCESCGQPNRTALVVNRHELFRIRCPDCRKKLWLDNRDGGLELPRRTVLSRPIREYDLRPGVDYVDPAAKPEPAAPALDAPSETGDDEDLEFILEPPDDHPEPTGEAVTAAPETSVTEKTFPAPVKEPAPAAAAAPEAPPTNVPATVQPAPAVADRAGSTIEENQSDGLTPPAAPPRASAAASGAPRSQTELQEATFASLRSATLVRTSPLPARASRPAAATPDAAPAAPVVQPEVLPSDLRQPGLLLNPLSQEPR